MSNANASGEHTSRLPFSEPVLADERGFLLLVSYRKVTLTTLVTRGDGAPSLSNLVRNPDPQLDFVAITVPVHVSNPYCGLVPECRRAVDLLGPFRPSPAPFSVILLFAVVILLLRQEQIVIDIV